MDYSDAESESDGELADDILQVEDLFSDEADEADNDPQSEAKGESVSEKEESKKEQVEKKIKQPRVVKNPRVTLNFESLQGKNGLSALKALFKNFKFKGNGHEEEDLSRIMGILQQWMCYQLCPSYDFETCMLQMEILGKKKVVQTLMKKYRLGMDEWGESKLDDEDNSITDKAMEFSENINKDDEFDLLLNAEIANSDSETEINQTDITESQSTQKEPDLILTQEQLDRIARNKRIAEERRKQRMNQNVDRTEVNQGTEVSAEKTHSESQSS